MTRRPASNRLNRRRLSLAGLFLLCVLLASASFMPAAWKNALHTRGKFHLCFHVIAFAVLGLLALRSTRSYGLRAALFAGVLLLGFALEFSQSALYHYPLEQLDTVADIAGALIGAFLIALVEPSTIPAGPR